MPITALKDNPPSQLQKKSILETDGTWWIAKVKPQQEKAFAFDLIELGVEYYLPYYTKVTRRSDGKCRKSALVLFPSYVPVISEKPYHLLNTNRVVTMLPIESQNRFKEQLNQIWVINNSETKVMPVDCKVQVSDYVRIISGSLKGIFGHVVEVNGFKSVLLRVDGLGAVSVRVDSSQIKKEIVN